MSKTPSSANSFNNATNPDLKADSKQYSTNTTQKQSTPAPALQPTPPFSKKEMQNQMIMDKLAAKKNQQQVTTPQKNKNVTSTSQAFAKANQQTNKPTPVNQSSTQAKSDIPTSKLKEDFAKAKAKEKASGKLTQHFNQSVSKKR